MLTESSLIQTKIEQREKKNIYALFLKYRQTAKGHKRVNNHQMMPSSFTERKIPQ